MAEEFPDETVPPIGDQERDERFHLDFRDGIDPQDDPLMARNPLFEEIMPPIDGPTEQGGLADFTPHQNEAFGLPLLKACIKDDVNGEDDFTTQIGRIYWRKEREINMSDDEGSSAGDICDPCNTNSDGTDQIGKDCYAAKEIPEGNVDHTHPEP